VTPVSSEAVTDLLSLIQQNSHHDEPNAMRNQRLVQKLTKSAQRYIARHALDQNYIGLLRDANNEAGSRRKTKSDILKKPGKNGEGRVMRQEDLEAIRADRAERAKQDAAKKAAGKAKRGRPKATMQANEGQTGKGRGQKRIRSPSDEGVPEDPQAAQTSEALIDLALEFWRAPVAQMW
jgi:hypothetical protein